MEKFEAQQRQIEAAKRKMQFAASPEGLLNACDIKVSIKVLKDNELDSNGRFILDEIAINVKQLTI